MPVRKKKKKINKHKANKPLLSKVKLLDAQSIREIRGEAFERFAKCDFKFLPEYCKLLIETKEKTNLLIAGSLLYFMYDKGFHGISDFQNLRNCKNLCLNQKIEKRNFRNLNISKIKLISFEIDFLKKKTLFFINLENKGDG